MLMADETWGMHGACGAAAPPSTTGQVTPDVGSKDNHGDEGRNAVFTDGHVEWCKGPSIDKWFNEAQADYDKMPAPPTVGFETID